MPENPYTILRYNPAWLAQFETIATHLRTLLGPLALRIDHIGSTSIPNLPAKDIIDLQITVTNLQDPAPLPTLTAAGYRLRPKVTQDHIPPSHTSAPADWQKHFLREPQNTRTAHIHIRPTNKPNQRYALLFRDYLRTHPAAAQAYAQIKQRLAPKLERLDYIEAKDPVCDLITQSAEIWALATSWTPGPSDA